MPTFRSVSDWRKNNRKRIKMLDNMKSVSDVTKKIISIQKNLAPKKTRETVSKLKSRKITKNKYMIESDVRPKGNSGFKQNQWSNRGPGHVMPRMWWNKGLPTLYGDGSHHITGMPGWFDRGAMIGRKMFPRFVIKEVRKIIKS